MHIGLELLDSAIYRRSFSPSVKVVPGRVPILLATW